MYSVGIETNNKERQTMHTMRKASIELRSSKLANKFFNSLAKETQEEMKSEFKRLGWSDWDNFIKQTVQGYMDSERRGEQMTNGAPIK